MSSPDLLDKLGVFQLLRERCRQAGGQEAFAAAAGVSPGHLSDVLNARREPGPAILGALGLVRVTRYAKARTDKRRPAA